MFEKSSRLNWFNLPVLMVLALAGLIIRILFALPELRTVDLVIDRPEALRLAGEYLYRQQGTDPATYSSAAIFTRENDSDRYLQKALGSGAAAFLKQHDYELFYWLVRFFRPGEKEEYHIALSPRDGKILEFDHAIEDTAHREDVPQENARELAQAFLEKQCGVQFSEYELKDVNVSRRENRTDYSFSWMHRGVDVPWSKDENSGTSKLLTGSVVSGKEVLSFYKSDLFIPDSFVRYLEREQETGRVLSTIFSLLYWVILITGIICAVRAFHHQALRVTRPLMVRLAVVLFLFMAGGILNQFETVVMTYPTAQFFSAYVGRSSTQILMSYFATAVTFLLIAQASEAVRLRSAPQFVMGSFLHFVRSSFLSRSVVKQIAAGYATALVMLGLQAVIFSLGQKYVGVWAEEQWLTQFSSAYVPALAAISLAFRASLTEEMIFRVFVFHRLREWTRRSFPAIVLAALVWGFGHSGYMIFPTWFRGVEVTIVGLFLGVIYLRFGLISVLVAHYLFDAFWSSAGCLFGQVRPLYFVSSWIVLLAPLFWALWAFVRNASDEEKDLAPHFTAQERFNMQVLDAYSSRRIDEGMGLVALEEELVRHGWDPLLVREVIGQKNYPQP